LAYTKAPTQDSHNVVHVPTLGSSILVSDPDITNPTPVTLSYIDCFVQKEAQWGTEPQRVALKRKGWDQLATVTTASNTGNPAQSIVIGQTQNSVYFGRNTAFYRVQDVSTSAPSISSVVSGATGMFNQTAGTSAIDNTNAVKVCFLDSTSQLFTFNEDGSSPTTTGLTGSFSVSPTGYRNLVFLDGYLLAADSVNRIFNSGAAGALTTWANTDFISPEMVPDNLQWIDLHKNYLVAFGTNSTEFFYNAGIEVGSPLARQESYSSRVGIYHTGRPGRVTAKINDDLYFIGRNQSNNLGFYRLRNFQIDQIESQYFEGVLNFRGTIDDVPNSSVLISGVEPVIINNNSMVLISLSNGKGLLYYPAEDSWSILGNSDDPDTLNTDFPGYTKRIGYCFYPLEAGANSQPIILALQAVGDADIDTYVPDYSDAVSVTGRIYTEVIDFGINRYKHLARIDAIGDYDADNVTLAINSTPNYAQSFTALGTQNAGTIGYGNNISWYNLGAPRRFVLRLDLAGTAPAIHRGFDIEYNIGVA
jgi:hypothetical protein